MFRKLNFLRKLSNEEPEEYIELSLETLVLCIMLVCYIISGPLFIKNKIKIIKASGFTMIVGICITLINKFFMVESNFFKGFQFNNSLFFTLILPIIIFNAGYNTKMDKFLKYFRYILLFSICGTLITFLMISVITYILNSNGFFTTINDVSNNVEIINFSYLEILQFAAAISASDSVISLSMLMEDDEPKLNAISLGDSIFNNAVAISLFNAITDLHSGNKNLSFGFALEVLLWGAFVFVSSFLIGALIGILSSLFLKFMRKFNLNRVHESSIMLLCAFTSYILCDFINLSAMTALLACGLCMSHYFYYNLTYQAREESSLVSMALNTVAEALVFSSLGMTIVYYTTHSFSLKFVITQLILIFAGRVFTVYGQIYLLELSGVRPDTFKLKTIHKSILTNVGSIRGAVSFALSILIVTDNQKNKTLLVGSTIYIVFFTNIVCIFLSPLFKRREKVGNNEDPNNFYLNASDDKSMKADIFTFLHPNTEVSQPKAKKIKSEEKIKEEQESLIYRFIKFDNENLLPNIVLKWPQVKEDNNTVSRKIKKELGKWAEEREKNNNYKEVDTIGILCPGFETQGKQGANFPNEVKIQENISEEGDKDSDRNSEGDLGADKDFNNKKIEMNEISEGETKK